MKRAEYRFFLRVLVIVFALLSTALFVCAIVAKNGVMGAVLFFGALLCAGVALALQRARGKAVSPRHYIKEQPVRR